jgi:competence protein ComEC
LALTVLLPFGMPLLTAYFWSKAPFTRLLFALIAGISLQWQLQFSFFILIVLFSICFVLSLIYFLTPVTWKYRFGYVNGITINLLIGITGALLVWLHDIRNNKEWTGNYSTGSNYTVITIEEPLVEKTNSFKALASIDGVYSENKFESLKGDVVVYFKKDSSLKQLRYGSKVIFKKSLQEIKNAGNPGGFDYKQYSLFQGITHQINLSQKEFEILPTENQNWFHSFIFSCRGWVVSTLQKFVVGEKEQGLAEALLIGYKDDLDKNLVQSYTNTGVVHIIAISGMHLALIYGLLLLLTKPLRRKHLQLLRVILILSGLWLFTLLAGAQASVVRSAVMFTCIAIGEALSKKTSIYNTLALSAFILLAHNPFWLWDVGFQLSYAAVVSIVTFYRPIYNWFYFPNKILDFGWKTMAISIAAQILTTPISLYHFHQFPVLFLLTNIIAVPLSSIILFGEIVICALAWLHPVAKFLGVATKALIWCMNTYIERIESIYFSLWNGFSINIIQTILLSIAAVAICFWLIDKRKWTLWTALSSLLIFTVWRSFSFTEAYSQKKLIVYNVPKYTAIDLIDGRAYNFIGDSALLYDDFIRNFHIQPSRVLHRMNQNQALPINCHDFEFCSKHIAIIDSTQYFVLIQPKQKIDVLILSENPKLYISNLLKTFEINQIVIDGSVPQWKAKLWKHDCDSLNIHCFDVSEKGAFVMNL